MPRTRKTNKTHLQLDFTDFLIGLNVERARQHKARIRPTIYVGPNAQEPSRLVPAVTPAGRRVIARVVNRR